MRPGSFPYSRFGAAQGVAGRARAGNFASTPPGRRLRSAARWPGWRNWQTQRTQNPSPSKGVWVRPPLRAPPFALRASGGAATLRKLRGRRVPCGASAQQGSTGTFALWAPGQDSGSNDREKDAGSPCGLRVARPPFGNPRGEGCPAELQRSRAQRVAHLPGASDGSKRSDREQHKGLSTDAKAGQRLPIEGRRGFALRSPGRQDAPAGRRATPAGDRRSEPGTRRSPRSPPASRRGWRRSAPPSLGRRTRPGRRSRPRGRTSAAG